MTRHESRRLRGQADREQLRFAIYEVNKTANEETGESAWRVPEKRIQHLFSAGRKARGALLRADRPLALRESVKRLREVVDALALADDWTRRLSRSLELLHSESKRALEILVRRGCVPDELLICLEAQREWGPTGGTRDDTLMYRPRLIALTRRFEQLATACDRYLQCRMRSPRATFRLDPNIPIWLRYQVAHFKIFITDSDPKRTVRGTQAESALFSAMRDVKTITGSF
jgi:hypothetical protein